MNHGIGTATTGEMAARLTGPQVALLPVGATEQHGPNLGMAVDYRIAEELAYRVADELDGAAVVVPPLPYGLSGHHMAFAGTVSISADAFSAVLLDVVGSLASHGIRHFLFVNGHMGNQSILGVLTNRIQFELGYHAASAFYFSQAKDVIARHAKTARWGHACEVETSVAMALVPELVRGDSLVPGDLIEEYGYLEDNYLPHALQVPKSFAERTRNGAFGDATLATRKAGEEIVATAVERTAAFAREFLAKPFLDASEPGRA
ncbi:MAG: creatininase family protein [Euzebyales bacterium]|nr:creatininase family protein [Euzebyales bacterium]